MSGIKRSRSKSTICVEYRIFHLLLCLGSLSRDRKKVLLRCDENVDATEYQGILKDALQQQIYFSRFLFQQNYVTCHSPDQLLTNSKKNVSKLWPIGHIMFKVHDLMPRRIAIPNIEKFKDS